ncbi:hypothetical protein [Alkalihalobacterium chitinilyticum]|uniref:Uncharacterized protein n=1 Tax=Alkalihalobacterium chitinilyticum TaxID=2980103 RepID=A0ABT5VJW1_9BACI|nr:hypothetical protein [Alkalihalobacterium chitinilyticum]MDE5415486.1 hypothetical protein [Alkalihalobacterium chitinilyticum]
MALIGNTATLRVEFSNESGFRYDVQEVTLTIYDERKRAILTVPQADLEQQGVGVFQYDYVVPEGATPYYYEFSGVFEGKWLTGRRPLLREWTQGV